MLHTVRGNNFHGDYSVTLRGPATPFVLSASQTARYAHALCPFSDCTCGGGYGDGPAEDSALVVSALDLANTAAGRTIAKAAGANLHFDELVLIPTSARNQ